jgi:hypothetical protein
MPEASTIIARLRAPGNEWLAYFQETPGHAYYSDTPVKAVRRLLEGTEAESGVFAVLCDGAEGEATVYYEVTWDAPLLYFPCSACDGRGEYLGLLVREVCQRCGGRKVIAV